MLICDNCNQPIKDTNNEYATQSLCRSCAILAERTNPIHIAPMTEGDLELVLAWRSNPQIYRHFREQDGPLQWEAHVSWYDSRNSDRFDFIIHYQDRRIGVVSISSDDEISIYLGDFSARGQGVAKSSLNWMCNRFENRAPLIAEIHQENTKSQHLFKKCGFRKQAENGDWVEYIYDL